MIQCYKKWKYGTWQDRWCVGYLLAKTDPDLNILWSWILLRSTSGYGKMWSFALWWRAFNRSHAAVSYHVLLLLLRAAFLDCWSKSIVATVHLSHATQLLTLSIFSSRSCLLCPWYCCGCGLLIFHSVTFCHTCYLNHLSARSFSVPLNPNQPTSDRLSIYSVCCGLGQEWLLTLSQNKSYLAFWTLACIFKVQVQWLCCLAWSVGRKTFCISFSRSATERC